MPSSNGRPIKRHSPRRKSGYQGARNKSAGSGRLPAALPLAIESSQSLADVYIAKPTTHPNVFRKRIKRIQGKPEAGAWVRVFANQSDDEGQDDWAILGYGWYNPKSEIAVRLVRWSEEIPDHQFWCELVDRAVSLRETVLDLPSSTDCFRLIHAEADGIPGLVVDKYGDCLSAEIFCAAVAPRAEAILQLLSERLEVKHWLIQPGPHLQSQDGFDFKARKSSELPNRVIVNEGDVQFGVAFQGSHKTGFFCDQRENRKQLAEFSRGKSVLDVCCYTGGFAISAAKAGGAASVVGVDLDEAPLEVAKKNAALNQVKVKFTQADAFAYMRDMLRGGKQFDVVVLDPPKLIRNRKEIDEGTRKHFDLNRLAMQLVAPGGMMLTCSCAGLLQTADFTRLVRAAARSAFRPTDFNPNPQPRSMQILGHSGAATCHPVSANCPETEYLKAMWLRL